MAKNLVSKGDFAIRRGVTPARVSQWLSEGKISGEAIVGTGRHARIDEDLACQQLEEHLDLDQRAANGKLTSLALAIPIDIDTGLEVGRIIARVVDGVIPELASAVAAQLSCHPSTVSRQLRQAWREIATKRQAEAGVRVKIYTPAVAR